MLLELKFGGVFDGDDALAVGNEAGEHVEQRGLASAGASRDDDVEARPDGALKKVQHLGRDGDVAKKVGSLQRRSAEAADGDDGAVDGERRNDDVDARAVGETSVDHG